MLTANHWRIAFILCVILMIVFGLMNDSRGNAYFVSEAPFCFFLIASVITFFGWRYALSCEAKAPVKTP
jgi:hypothetical protein